MDEGTRNGQENKQTRDVSIGCPYVHLQKKNTLGGKVISSWPQTSALPAT